MFQGKSPSQLWSAEVWSQTVLAFCCHRKIEQQATIKLQWHKNTFIHHASGISLGSVATPADLWWSCSHNWRLVGYQLGQLGWYSSVLHAFPPPADQPKHVLIVMAEAQEQQVGAWKTSFTGIMIHHSATSTWSKHMPSSNITVHPFGKKNATAHMRRVKNWFHRYSPHPTLDWDEPDIDHVLTSELRCKKRLLLRGMLRCEQQKHMTISQNPFYKWRKRPS